MILRSVWTGCSEAPSIFPIFVWCPNLHITLLALARFKESPGASKKYQPSLLSSAVFSSSILSFRGATLLHNLMLTTKYIALSTQSVGVGPGRSHAPDRPLFSESNHPSSLVSKQAGSTSMLA